MASTYVPIMTQTLGSAQNTVTLSSIPSTYTDVVLICQLIPTAGCTGYFKLNGSSSSIYSDTWMVGYGSGSPASYRDSNQTQGVVGDMTGTTTVIMNLQNYANTSVYKTVLTRSSSAGNGVAANASLFRDTTAISSVSLIANGTTWAAGSTFTLYGIKAA